MTYEERQRSDALEFLERLESIITLAKSNFPRTGDMRVETCGSDPKGSMTLPWHSLKIIADHARRSLSKEGGEE